MNRRLSILVSSAALTVAAAAPAAEAAPTGDVRGRPCADIDSGLGQYTGSEVTFEYVISAPSCSEITYTLYVLDDAGDATPIAVHTFKGDGATTAFFFVVPVTTADGDVCVFGTTSAGPHVFDRAPDAGCVPLRAGGGSPGLQFR